MSLQVMPDDDAPRDAPVVSGTPSFDISSVIAPPNAVGDYLEFGPQPQRPNAPLLPPFPHARAVPFLSPTASPTTLARLSARPAADARRN